MKFGKHLAENARPEWRSQYLDFKALKDLIKESVAEVDASGVASFSPRTTSLTVQKGGVNRNLSKEEVFFQRIEEEIQKVGRFTLQLVQVLRSELTSLEDKVKTTGRQRSRATAEALEHDAKQIGDEFLQLEKYVNLNYLGFHKILKKHDKLLPHAPCRQFMLSQLHQQPWVRGNYSDLLVRLSNIYSALRGDVAGEKNEDSAQGFVRSTTKYWVRVTDVSAVKHHILQRLPVFQYSGEGAESGDAQLINSVYLDNTAMELYHGRLDKRPNALAIRMRWYGQNTAMVFVERKTHRESWKGEESVKERFVLEEAKVVPYLEGEYTLEDALRDLQARGKGKTDEEVRNFSKLFKEVLQAIDSKQLQPMIRTQYMRTAFQIPHDSTVRVSLDTNLVMMKENPDDGLACTVSHRWYRDPALPVPRSEITRFPHAVLEVKLSLPEGTPPPEWITQLLNSGYLTEVHKFSKFIHGTSVLLPDMVQAVPYWIDDESIRESIAASASDRSPNASPSEAPGPLAATKPRKTRLRGSDEDSELTHPLLGARDTHDGRPHLRLMPDPGEVQGLNGEVAGRRRGHAGGLLDWWFAPRRVQSRAGGAPVAMRIEPKTFFANERTFLTWLHMAVTTGSIASVLLGLSGTTERAQPGERLVEVIGMILLPVAIFMCAYAMMVFLWRSKQITVKQVGYIDDRFGPLGLTVVVVTALSAIMILSILDFANSL